jgi:hypothetical protein
MSNFMLSSSVAFFLHFRRLMISAIIATMVSPTKTRESTCVSNQRPSASADTRLALVGLVAGVPDNHLTGNGTSDGADEADDRPTKRLREKADCERKGNDERRSLVALRIVGYSSHNRLPLFASLSLH